MLKLDETDLKILDVLKDNSKLSTSKLSKKTGIPITTVFNRIKKLEREKIIRKYTINVDEKRLGKLLTAYIVIHYDISVWDKESTRGELRHQLLSLPNVEEIKYISGRFDILLKVCIKDMDELNSLILGKLRKIPGIGQTETFFVMEDVK
ncbi:Lrp/AsnC family transcriptional regulator [Candidatus Woesearchaeota archaeon]|nr:Lrp/AsnC family transcriptional regulator [Candidatus Woesearchaeota archaeon]